MKLILGICMLGLMSLAYLSGYNSGYNHGYTFVDTKDQEECKKQIDNILAQKSK